MTTASERLAALVVALAVVTATVAVAPALAPAGTVGAVGCPDGEVRMTFTFGSFSSFTGTYTAYLDGYPISVEDNENTTGSETDTYSTCLTYGQSYTVEQRGSSTDDGTLSDPFIKRVDDADGTYYGSNDDDRERHTLNSKLTFTPNRPPTADATPDGTTFTGPTTVVEGATDIQFDGTDSADPDGDSLTYSWSWGDGAAGSGATPTHDYADAVSTNGGSAQFSPDLWVSDSNGGSDTDADFATITVYNDFDGDGLADDDEAVGVPTDDDDDGDGVPDDIDPQRFVPDTTAPKADGGENVTVRTGELVTFNGSGSSDDAAVDTYAWDFDDDGHSDATGATPEHTFEAVGTYTVTLTVTDLAGNTDTDTVTVEVEPRVAATPLTVVRAPSFDLDADGDGVADAAPMTLRVLNRFDEGLVEGAPTGASIESLEFMVYAGGEQFTLDSTVVTTGENDPANVTLAPEMSGPNRERVEFTVRASDLDSGEGIQTADAFTLTLSPEERSHVFVTVWASFVDERPGRATVQTDVDDADSVSVAPMGAHQVGDVVDLRATVEDEFTRPVDDRTVTVAAAGGPDADSDLFAVDVDGERRTGIDAVVVNGTAGEVRFLDYAGGNWTRNATVSGGEYVAEDVELTARGANVSVTVTEGGTVRARLLDVLWIDDGNTGDEGGADGNARTA